MKNLIYSILIGSVLLLMACTPTANNGSTGGDYAEPEGAKLFFQTVEQRAMSGINDKEEHVVTENKQWGSLWAKINSNMSPVPNMPQMDFSKETVLAVFMGQKNTGGFGIEIKRVIDTGKQIVVMVEESSPPEGAIVTMAITQPYHIVKIENPDGKSVIFRN